MGKSITQEIKTTISCLNYNEVCKLSQIVFDAFKKVDVDEAMKFAIHFKMGEVSIELDNYNDFSQTSYGQDIRVISLMLSNYEHKVYVHIHPYTFDKNSIDKSISLRVSCEDIPTLLKMVTHIEGCLISEGSLKRIKQKTNTSAVMLSDVIKESRSDIGVPPSVSPQLVINVGGDLNMNDSTIGYKNKVGNQGNVQSYITEGKVKVPEKSSFWEGVSQQITANWIWWLLGILGTAFVSYLGFA